jgi:hypothetical protein
LQTRGWFSQCQSFRITRKLDTFLERMRSVRSRDQHAQAHAILRAFLTVVIELMKVPEDACGCIGDSFHDGFAPSLAMPRDETGIEDVVFFRALLTRLIWEDYGLTDDRVEQGEAAIPAHNL